MVNCPADAVASQACWWGWPTEMAQELRCQSRCRELQCWGFPGDALGDLWVSSKVFSFMILD